MCLLIYCWDNNHLIHSLNFSFFLSLILCTCVSSVYITSIFSLFLLLSASLNSPKTKCKLNDFIILMVVCLHAFKTLHRKPKAEACLASLITCMFIYIFGINQHLTICTLDLYIYNIFFLSNLKYTCLVGKKWIKLNLRFRDNFV